jgi:hypothetical protein
MRVLCALVLILGLALPAEAQDVKGWSFSGSLSGSANSAGVVMRVDPMLGYTFNKHLSGYGGLPFYLVNLKSTTTSTTTTNEGFMSGVGNAFFGIRGTVEGEALDYSSTVEITAPTGDEERGFSTGDVTIDWTNRFSRTFSSVTPFGTVGIANTVSDTAFFVRPFSSKGVVGHFEGGATYAPPGVLSLSASAYAVRGSGEQRVISRVRRAGAAAAAAPGRVISALRRRVFEEATETVAQPEIINDHGFSTWIGVAPRPEVDFHVGYSRSVGYAYNSLFFGIGFHIGH